MNSLTDHEARPGQDLTSQSYWDDHWSSISLPVIETVDQPWTLGAEIIKTIERHVPLRPAQKVLEIGGAPGGFLAYFAKTYNCEVHALDFSGIGCEKTRQNFNVLQLKVAVYDRDLFEAVQELPQFDFVYSLGFVEHFKNLREVLAAHWKLVRPGGYLAIGIPRFVSVYWGVLKRLAPDVTQGHNRATLNFHNWRAIEEELGMLVQARAYLGGFDPCMMASVIEEEAQRYSAKDSKFLRSFSNRLRQVAYYRSRVERLLPATRSLGSLCPARLRTYGISVYQKTVNATHR